MAVLYVVIPIALLIAAGAVAAFVWMVRTGQLDDLDSPPVRMLFDDAESPGVRHETPRSPDKPGSARDQ